MSILVIVRHGQSQYNLENRFTGWTDVPLTPLGREEAAHAGELLKPFRFDAVYTSVLKRAIDTLDIIQHTLGTSLPAIQAAALNERGYGDLQGLNKTEIQSEYGEKLFQEWRRSYKGIPPNGESLEMTYTRVIPYYQSEIEPRLKSGKNILIVAHGNSLRALMMYLEHISEEDIAHTDLATGVPKLYEINTDGTVLKTYYITDQSAL